MFLQFHLKKAYGLFIGKILYLCVIFLKRLKDISQIFLQFCDFMILSHFLGTTAFYNDFAPKNAIRLFIGKFSYLSDSMKALIFGSSSNLLTKADIFLTLISEFEFLSFIFEIYRLQLTNLEWNVLKWNIIPSK